MVVSEAEFEVQEIENDVARDECENGAQEIQNDVDIATDSPMGTLDQIINAQSLVILKLIIKSQKRLIMLVYSNLKCKLKILFVNFLNFFNLS